MTNLEIAWIFNEIADLMELKGDNIFKVRAYRKAADILHHLPEEIENIYHREELNQIPGIGKILASKVEEILQTGRCSYLERLREEIPQGLKEMLAIPGLGPKSVQTIYKRLNITTLEELEEAARKKRIRKLPGMGSKTELNILRGIEMLRRNCGQVPMGLAMSLAEALIADLKGLPEVERIEITGDLRRGREMVEGVDLLIGSQAPQGIISVLNKSPKIKQVLSCDEHRIEATTWLGIRVIINIVEPENFYLAWQQLTGSAKHNQRLQERGDKFHLKLSPSGLIRSEGHEMLPVKGEEDIYRYLELPYIPPVLREDTGEIEAAIEGRLPELIQLADIKGDLHVHSNWSDGVSEIIQLVEAARERGYQYLAITDHSKSLKIAGGLSEEKLREQREVLRSLEESLGDIHLLAGVEVDILPDGSLDYEDSFLEEMDLVIASVHTHFRMEKDRMTARIESALKNPLVDILAHPTGRILGRRDPYAVDLEYLMEVAARTGTCMEINASPDRLDLNEKGIRKAKEYGIPLAINTDAHDALRLEDMRYGIITAQRGWLERKDVVNAWDFEELKRWLGL
ncbi:DNA polymerase/3'-5' exonuclease PolX [Calderihabitans maritimus]|uniref:DNA polymerase beta n=1 Tax=Calderihabitans maritimus TaxID=1246530 RepID=A0A1Z5HRW5_9FIRM|nr:DNA polymerase/3'-5' exonuclease PolX [Calderihabitans maritimus]GAW92269.1 PHP domain-containing protein [Calderihabitans maritimus]